MSYVIEDITFRKTGETRNDGKYPTRIGSTVYLLSDVEVGKPLYFRYIKYNDGTDVEEHITRTSIVNDFDNYSKRGYLYVFTNNSIYKFKELSE